MSKDKKKYGSAYIPEPPKEVRRRGSGGGEDKIAEIEKSVEAIRDSLAKSNRDNQDAMYNIDMDNLSTSMRRLLASYGDGIVSAKAEIKTWADSQQAGFDAVAEWQSATNNAVSEIRGTSGQNSAAISSLVQFQKTVEDGTITSISSINQKADENSADISALASWKSTADSEIDSLAESMAVIEATANDNEASISQIVTAVGKNGNVTAASIVSAVNSAGSSVKISADHVEIEGVVEILKEDGSVLIDGNNISLIADINGDYQSEVRFNKHYIAESGAIKNDLMAHIYTVDNKTESDDRARFATILETEMSKIPEDSSKSLAVALKLISAGNMSLEAGNQSKNRMGMIYMKSTEGIILDPGTNIKSMVRIHTHHTYDADDLLDNCYHFCWDGIYFGSQRIVST